MSQRQEATYEVRDVQHGRIRVIIFLPSSPRSVQHGVSIEKAKQHPDGMKAYIEEKVQQIAARHSETHISDDEEIPESGAVEFDPRTRDGKPREEKLEDVNLESKDEGTDEMDSS